MNFGQKSTEISKVLTPKPNINKPEVKALRQLKSDKSMIIVTVDLR